MATWCVPCIIPRKGGSLSLLVWLVKCRDHGAGDTESGLGWGCGGRGSSGPYYLLEVRTQNKCDSVRNAALWELKPSVSSTQYKLDAC